MPKLDLFGTPVTHSNGRNPRPTRLGIKALLTARPDLRVRLSSKFDGMIDGMADVADDGTDDRDSLWDLLARASPDGFGAYMGRDRYGLQVLRIYSYSMKFDVSPVERDRRKADLATLPGLSNDAYQARGEWLADACLDDIGWDEAMSELRNITTADHLVVWLQSKGPMGFSAMRLATRVAEDQIVGKVAAAASAALLSRR
jgi:hypothetical protein